VVGNDGSEVDGYEVLEVEAVRDGACGGRLRACTTQRLIRGARE
jgi:hypothetical protein